MLKKYGAILALLFIIGAGLFGVKALLPPGYYTSHDGWTQVIRLSHYREAFLTGQFPPRFSFNLLNGFGYPLFTFSYHLPWLMALPIILSGVSIFDTIKLVFAIGYIVSGIFMFLWQRELWGNKGATVAAFLYLWAPYRFSNIFVRASLGEATSFMCIPLFFFGIHRLYQSRRVTGVFLTAIGLAGILLSHIMVAYFLFIPTIAYLIALFERRWEFYIRITAGIVLAAGLAAFYLIPAVAFQHLTIFENVKHMFFQNGFVPLSGLLYSPWGYGPAFTGPGQMSLQLGIGQWAVFLFATALVLFTLAQKLRAKKFGKITLQMKLGLAFVCVFIINLFLILPASKQVWNFLSRFVAVDYQWRLLSILTLCSALLSGFLIWRLPRRWQLVGGAALILLAVYANRNHIRVNQYTDIPLARYLDADQTTNTYKEYLPKGVPLEIVGEKKKREIEVGENVKVTAVERKVNRFTFNYTADKSAPFTIYLIYFPGMQLLLDGKPQTFSYAERGFLQANFPSGSHQVLVKMGESPVGRIADIISALALGIVGVWVIREVLSFTKLRRAR